MNENDPQRISLAICAAFKALPRATAVDRRAMARWLQTEFPGHTIEELSFTSNVIAKRLAALAGEAQVRCDPANGMAEAMPAGTGTATAMVARIPSGGKPPQAKASLLRRTGQGKHE